MATLQLTVDLKHVEGGRIQAQLVELPGVITSTQVREQVLPDLADALAEYLLAGAPVPLPPLDDDAVRIPIVITLTA